MTPSRFQFKHPHLTKLNFQLNEELLAAEEAKVMLKTTFRVNISDYQFEDGLAAVALEVIISGDQDKAVPFGFSGEMESVFCWDTKETDAEFIQTMLSQNAPALLLSYFRPIIAQTTMQAGINAYNIPFMDFTKHSKSEE